MRRKGTARLVALLGLGGAIVNCGGPAKEAGRDEPCFRVTECMAGLVCIDHKCTDDLTSVNFRTEAGARDAGGPGGGGGD